MYHFCPWFKHTYGYFFFLMPYHACEQTRQNIIFMFQELKVTGLKIHKITRIQNRVLKMKFDQKLENITTDTDERGTNIYK